jgi:hypothetical protein
VLGEVVALGLGEERGTGTMVRVLVRIMNRRKAVTAVCRMLSLVGFLKYDVSSNLPAFNHSPVGNKLDQNR